MPAPLPLLGGAYAAESLIAGAQRCVNLYPEINPEGNENPVTHYPTPGLVEWGTAPHAGQVRGVYFASNRELFTVIGANVYSVAVTGIKTLKGTLTTSSGPVSMADNKIELVIVDGTPFAFQVVLATGVWSAISDPAFYGADQVEYVDSFFIYNRPNTNQFYVGPSNGVTPLDPLYIASKEAKSDRLATLMVNHRELWLIGEQTTEVWFNAGAVAFPFNIISGLFIEHGTVAHHSPASHDISIYMLGQNKEGGRFAMTLTQQAPKRISTHAIEAEWLRYSRVDDAVGFTYMDRGHPFYVLTFPTADKTWVYDIATRQWHERVTIDSNGDEHRWIANCACQAYGAVVLGDHSNGKLYRLSPDVFTENGQPVIRIRSFPHMFKGGGLVEYTEFMADVEVGAQGVGNGDEIFLRLSDDRGRTWHGPLGAPIGPAGNYSVRPMWAGGLGTSAFRTFELSWSVNARVALNGAFVGAQALED